MKKYIRKADIILLIILLAAGFAASAVLAMTRSAGDSVIIESAGELYATYPLSEDRELRVPAPGRSDDYNIISIKDGKVSVTDASCKNQVCVNHLAISLGGESIVCLPNRMLVRIEGSSEEGDSYDSVTS